MGEELNKEFYDSVYEKGGFEKLYLKEAKEIKSYYPTWKYSYDYIIEKGIKNIIDLGCGPGHFASLFKNGDDVSYTGYDFSVVAIEQAIKRNKNVKNMSFKVQNLNEIKIDKKHNFYTSFEFLEHISFDREILGKLQTNDNILFSVPNYDSRGHVRHYKSFNEIVDRYKDLLEINLVHEIKISGTSKIYLCHGVRK
jgi:2-polyprenyl-3-methyl-5-hydroxy-6-metoxy-1,4-benzoquinol methylase